MTERTIPRPNLRTIISLLIFVFYPLIVLYLASGDARWWIAWIYAGLSVGLTLGSRALMIRKNPDLAAERIQYQDVEGVKPWDQKIRPLISFYGPLLILVIAGLDRRFGWSGEHALWVVALAILIAVLGFAFSTWALVENRYFSAVVRIQTDRAHSVCTTGPYRVVRHPGYAGAILWYLMTPLVLSSWWAFIPTVITSGLVMLRTALEDQTLQAELPGYREYTQQTRYRLIPGIW